MRTEKRCPRCKETFFGDLTVYFFRAERRGDGLDWQCKSCKRIHQTAKSQKIRDRRKYEKDRLKLKAREAARKEYTGRLLWCAVLRCEEKAEELHHVDYDQPLAVVPLCSKHHRGIHDR